MTTLEQRAWDIFKSLRYEGIHVRRQHPIGRYHADFAILRARLAIEIDGPHHEDALRQESDRKRDVYFQNAGWRVLRITSKQMNDGLDLLAMIRDALPSPRGEGAGGGAKRDVASRHIDSGEINSPYQEDHPTPLPPPLAGRGNEPSIPPGAQRRTRANRKLAPRRKA